MKFNRWSEEELVLLKKVYPTKPNRKLLKYFPRHTASSIQGKASKLKIRKKYNAKKRPDLWDKNNSRFWSKEEDEILKNNYEKTNIDKLNKMLLNRTKNAIWSRGELLGLSRPTNGRFKKDHIRSEESRRKQARTVSGENNVSARPEVRKKISEHHKKAIEEGKWHPSSWVTKRPTIPEKNIIKILKKHKFPFKYVGDGKFKVGRLNPDFVNKDKDKVIEVFGRMFHDPKVSYMDDIPDYRTYEGRMKLFKKHNIGCLILWEEETEDEAYVVETIKKFLIDD